jgi:uncharacterized protein with FMN-binding domain
VRKSIKPIIVVVLTGIGSALVFSFRTTDPTLPTTANVPAGVVPIAKAPTRVAPTATAPALTTPTTGSPTDTTTSAPTQGTATAPATPTGAFVDGTYTGAAVNEPWGTFEVEAIISGGQLTDVQLVAEPSDRHSSRINNYAVPLLTESAIAAQSANIDMVSGATWTSRSYEESLQAALDAAAASAVTQQQDAA